MANRLLDQPPPHIQWHRQARLHRVIDGDTVDLDVDLGWKMTQLVRFRLDGVDTPEKNDRDIEVRRVAIEAQGFVERWMKQAEERHRLLSADPWPLVVRSVKTGKYGRWLAIIWAKGEPESLNKSLLIAGLAEEYPR